MRVLIAAVGRMRAGPEKALYEHYAGRLAWPIDIREVEDRRAPTGAQRLRREGDLLLAAISDSAVVVTLDEAGKALDSLKFAARLGDWRDRGRRHVAFVIGGADGLDPRLHKRADLVFSLGPMTWPHLLVRALLAEQLYRAQQILAGHPYHRA